MKTDSFLNTLSILEQKHRMLNEQKEKFNIFTVLHKPHDERRLHSRFIAALLSPKGSHKKNSLFLSNFLNVLNSAGCNIPIEKFLNAEVSPDESEKKETDNFDILLFNKLEKYAIIIENKIYAADSNLDSGGQLDRYYKTLTKDYKVLPENIWIFYLTLDRHCPTDKSLGEIQQNKNTHFYCISYPEEIVLWLNSCLSHVADKPFIRESLFQYQKLIKEMTHDNLDIQERLELRDSIAKSDETMRAAKYLIDNFHHVKWHTVDEFWKELAFELEKQGCKIKSKPNVKEITGITHFEVYRRGQKKKQRCGIEFYNSKNKVFFIWHDAGEPLNWGFYMDSVSDNKLPDLNLFKKGSENPGETYYWRFFFEEKHDCEQIVLSDFHHEGTFNLINQQTRKLTIELMLEEIVNLIGGL